MIVRKNFLFYLWQLPQHLLALVIKLIVKPENKEIYKNVTIYKMYNYKFAISLGNYIFINSGRKDEEILKAHEYGHSIQSLILGPLYLFIVGVPSITQNILSTITYIFGYKKMYSNYYNRFPENWADKLGGVERK